ncbi:DUF222 domain-containing protein [Nocardioides sp.]|uniref:HNH endonuclease signature motif containing protein n=1 Tax=Nocardioides sp. TaxID=35761 RepID=UPI003D1368CC
MSIQQLHEPAVTGWLEAARDAVLEGAAVPAVAIAETELATAIDALSRLESQVAAWRLALVAEVDARGVAAGAAETGTDAWLAKLTGDTRAVAAGGLFLARRLQETYDSTRAAFAAGRLRMDQVRVIVQAADRAPDGASAAQIREAEELLVAKATGDANRSGRPMDARHLRQVARRMFETMSVQVADQHESELLGEEERRAHRETWLTLHDNGDGTFAGRFVIPELHGQLLRSALDRLTAPRRLGRDKGGELVVDPTLPTAGPCLSWSERNGVAFLELLEHLPTAGHSGNVATLVVQLELDALLSGIGAAGLDTGIRISATEARRLACEAGLVPAVLGGPSVPLDLGRTRRLHTPSQRQALSVAHDSCAVAGCERPFAWCEIHHLHPWSRGGHTDLDNALPLCGFHHRRAHDDLFDLRRHSSGEWRFHRRR